MKKKLFTTAMAVLCLSMAGFSQTKGTNALGLGVNVTTEKNTYNLTTDSKIKNKLFTLGYGYFFKDNNKIGVELSYGNNKSDYSSLYLDYKTYGGKLTYQRYFPIIKSLFAHAGGKATYIYGKQKQNITQDYSYQEIKSNQYFVGAYGGITWFLSKRFALETDLLSANVMYRETKETYGNPTSNYGKKSTEFNLKSEGFINDLGFKIYILF